MYTQSTILMTAVLACSFFGRSAMANEPLDDVSSDNASNTAMGPYVLSGLSGGYQNTAGGYLTLDNLTSGFKTSAFGYLALSTNATGIDNAAFGANALFTNAGSGSWNSAFGSDALHSLGNGANYNTAVGFEAAFGSKTGIANVAIGASSLSSNAAGESNTTVGTNSLNLDQAGSSDVAVGNGAMEQFEGSANIAVGYNALLDGNGASNVAVGGSALQHAQSSYNTGVGYSALGQDSTGSNNIGLGYLGGNAPATGSSNIEIGAIGYGPDEILPAGSTFDENLIRLGTSQEKTFIAGIYEKSVAGNAVYVNSLGQLGVVVSAERFKTAIADVPDPDKLSRLHPVTFHLKSNPRGPLQYGLIAEEVAKVYPELLVRDEHGKIDAVRYEELAPMLLHKLQMQDQEFEQLNAQMATLDTLQQQIADECAALRVASMAAR